MKQETFEIAQKINQSIFEIDDAINKVEKGIEDCGRQRVINYSFSYDIEEKLIEESVINYLKRRKAALKKEFSNLK